MTAYSAQEQAMTKRKPNRLCHIADCTTEIPDEVYVCDKCLSELDYLLDQFPTLWTELETTLTKQSVFSASGGRKGSETPLMFHISASDIAHRINNTLATWARVVMHDYACPISQPDKVDGALAEWMRDQLPWIARQRFGAEAVQQISDEVRVIFQVIDVPAPQRYLGLCDCGTALYVTQGATYLPCPNCTLLHDVEAKQNAALLDAEDRLERASVLSRAVTMLGECVTQVHISRWVARGRLLAKGHDREGKPLYRLGDVRALAQEMEAKKRA